MSKPSLATCIGVAAVPTAEDGDMLIAAAFLQDVGYAPSLNGLASIQSTAPTYFVTMARSAWPVLSPITPGPLPG